MRVSPPRVSLRVDAGSAAVAVRPAHRRAGGDARRHLPPSQIRPRLPRLLARRLDVRGHRGDGGDRRRERGQPGLPPLLAVRVVLRRGGRRVPDRLEDRRPRAPHRDGERARGAQAARPARHPDRTGARPRDRGRARRARADGRGREATQGLPAPDRLAGQAGPPRRRGNGRAHGGARRLGRPRPRSPALGVERRRDRVRRRAAAGPAAGGRGRRARARSGPTSVGRPGAVRRDHRDDRRRQRRAAAAPPHPAAPAASRLAGDGHGRDASHRSRRIGRRSPATRAVRRSARLRGRDDALLAEGRLGDDRVRAELHHSRRLEALDLPRARQIARRSVSPDGRSSIAAGSSTIRR